MAKKKKTKTMIAYQSEVRRVKRIMRANERLGYKYRYEELPDVLRRGNSVSRTKRRYSKSEINALKNLTPQVLSSRYAYATDESGKQTPQSSVRAEMRSVGSGGRSFVRSKYGIKSRSESKASSKKKNNNTIYYIVEPDGTRVPIYPSPNNSKPSAKTYIFVPELGEYVPMYRFKEVYDSIKGDIEWREKRNKSIESEPMKQITVTPEQIVGGGLGEEALYGNEGLDSLDMSVIPNEWEVAKQRIEELMELYDLPLYGSLKSLLSSEISQYGEEAVYTAMCNLPYDAIEMAQAIIHYKDNMSSQEAHRAYKAFADDITGVIASMNSAKAMGNVMDSDDYMDNDYEK